jgi:hypothetical protein
MGPGRVGETRGNDPGGGIRGDVVAAARWLGASMVLASAVLVVGLRWVLSTEAARLADAIRARPGAPREIGGADPEADAAALKSLMKQFTRDSRDTPIFGEGWDRPGAGDGAGPRPTPGRPPGGAEARPPGTEGRHAAPRS